MLSAGQARAFWIAEPGRGEIRSEPIGAPGSGEVAVRTLYSALSLGTEKIVFKGAVPASEYERMRAPFQAGQFPGPVKYGYINVGIVEAGPPDLVGRTVFCLFPHQTHYVVPAESVHCIPDDVPAQRAVLAATMETAVNGLWDAEPAPGSHVAVIGAGAVGCLIAWLASTQHDCRVELIDVNRSRRTVAQALGVAFAEPARARSGADIVFHVSGTRAGLVTALGLAGFEATIMEMSWFGDAEICLPLGGAFHSQRLTIRSSQVSSIAKPQRGKITHAARMQYCMERLREPALDALIESESRFEDLPQTLKALSEQAATPVCHRIVYSQDGS